jgi:biotin synthase
MRIDDMTQLNIAPTPADTAASNHNANHVAAGAKPVAKWRVADIVALYELPFNDLMFRAQQTHREHFDANTVQLSTLLSIKTGGCEEDCAYCPQSVHHDTGLQADKLMPVDEVLAAAKVAKDNGATRFCMGAAWRNPKDRHLEPIKDMIRGVKAMGLETCVTLGMLETHQAQGLREAGLDYYNHNLDTSPEFYGKVITTRTYQDRLQTIAHVRKAGITVCCGGILGMGESDEDRVGLLHELSRLDPHPESVPINMLVRNEGTPLADVEELDPLIMVRAIATARILMPASRVRLAAGRRQMSPETVTLCFLAGANSIFSGEKLLTTPNPAADADRQLLTSLGMKAMQSA